NALLRAGICIASRIESVRNTYICSEYLFLWLASYRYWGRSRDIFRDLIQPFSFGCATALTLLKEVPLRKHQFSGNTTGTTSNWASYSTHFCLTILDSQLLSA